jgi:hypothetical protein
VLTISSGGNAVASIDFAGSYVTSNFKLSAGPGGSGTIITDPAVPGGGYATLGYSAGGGMLAGDAALLGHYIATTFVTPAGSGGILSSEPPLSPPLLALAHPHA